MKRRDAELVVAYAAGRWLNELNEYIIPGAPFEEDQAAYEAESEKLERALAIVNNELDAEDFHDKNAGDWGKCPF